MPSPSRETKTKFSGANGDREISIFPVQLTTSRIGDLTRLSLTLAICDDHTYIMVTTRYSDQQGSKLRQNPCQVQPTENIGNLPRQDDVFGYKLQLVSTRD